MLIRDLTSRRPLCNEGDASRLILGKAANPRQVRGSRPVPVIRCGSAVHHLTCCQIKIGLTPGTFVIRLGFASGARGPGSAAAALMFYST